MIRQRDHAGRMQNAELFGGCPRPGCGGCEGRLNIRREHRGYCVLHSTRWRIGANLFSDWRRETPKEWEENAAVLEPYEEVEFIEPFLEEGEEGEDGA